MRERASDRRLYHARTTLYLGIATRHALAKLSASDMQGQSLSSIASQPKASYISSMYVAVQTVPSQKDFSRTARKTQSVTSMRTC